MSVEPSRENISLASHAETSHSMLSPLIGREAELRALLRLLHTGGTTVINVTGAPGGGKSALVSAALRGRSRSLFVDVQRLDLTGESMASAMMGLRHHVSHAPIPLHRDDSRSNGERILLHVERADVLARSGQELSRLLSGHGGLILLVESVPQMRDATVGIVHAGPLGPDAAGELFRRTAESVAVSLKDDEESRDSIRRICSAVDGNALAIELAALRLPLAPLASLADLLETPERALAVLTMPARVGTTRAVRTGIADTRRTSSADAQQLLDSLSVFSGSFTIGAIEAVCAGQLPSCYDALGELLDLRLVELDQDTGGREGRYRLSNLVHWFAAERLTASGAAAEARVAHAAHYSEVAQRAAAAFDDADEEAARRLLGEDYAEALAAARWLAASNPDAALRLAADLGWTADRYGNAAALIEVLTALTHTTSVGTAAARRDALLWLAAMASWSPVVSDRSELIGRQLEEGLGLGRQIADPLPFLRALHTHFNAAAGLGEFEAAMRSCVEGLRLASEIGHTRWLGRFEISLGTMNAALRRYEEAASLTASGFERAMRAGDRTGVALGSLALHALPPECVTDRAELPSLEGVLEMFRAQSDLVHEMHTLAILAQDAIESGDSHRAAAWVLTRQERLGRMDLLNGLTISAMCAVQISLLRGEPAIGAFLHGSIAAHIAPLMAIMSPAHSALYRHALDSIRGSLSLEDYARQTARGRMLDRDETLSELLTYLREVVDAAPAPPAASAAAASPELTPREHQVLRLLAQGLHNKEIAGALRITPKSVMHHTVSIYRKLGVRGRTEAVTAALHSGMLSP
ncbi:DNA-binding CsgD family transcriptional regulator/predicted ATPase [Microbacterium sp. W4I4]|uniref:LuxR C-terminal-related transcriptional regulator n=1 Tax=Microbacterium sp. W4I4 TaxID=3042295 RepID=UPI00277E468F|nr:LuxR C-terminal-related transcriptional regulator [Microbacterium sp. W4I4]MDQ0613979.1 DNA-binding CsgD family transcriptional regulator/predicted ATPase [Microbacterium sp. W4I4]